MEIGKFLTQHLGAKDGFQAQRSFTEWRDLVMPPTSRYPYYGYEEDGVVDFLNNIEVLPTYYWQAALRTPQLLKKLAKLGTRLASPETEFYIVRHGEPSKPRFDLLVLDPSIKETAVLNNIDLSLKSLRRGSLEFVKAHIKDDTDARTYMPILRGWPVLRWVQESMDFGVVLTNPGERIALSKTPDPALSLQGTQMSTVGVIVNDFSGRKGVTGACHAVGTVGTEVAIGGITGTVVSADSLTDSCFIEIEVGSETAKPSKGPLTAVTPRKWESVDYVGIKSKGPTRIIAWSPELPYLPPNVQLRVLTEPTTAPGDSGAALIDSDGYVVGFAFYRTGFGHDEGPEHASWIWAESVYKAHNLQYYRPHNSYY